MASLLVKVREVAETHLAELHDALAEMAAEPNVRPADEYRSAHLPFARSMPLAELKQRVEELPRGKPIVAYCRGPFCVLSDSAVALLRKRGYRALMGKGLLDGNVIEFGCGRGTFTLPVAMRTRGVVTALDKTASTTP